SSSEPMIYPLLYPFGTRGFKYGDEKLYPPGTTREEAGFTESDDYLNEDQTPPPSEREQTPMDISDSDEDEMAIRGEILRDERILRDDDAEDGNGDSSDSGTDTDDDNEEHLAYNNSHQMVERTQSPVDFAQLLDPEKD
ncbi:hypothetical protein PENTCL1PPCAC_8412, partial [Pristionchus entomophagus]